MRLLKAQNTNLRTINGLGVQFDVNDQVFMESTNVMRIPKGTTAQRPTTPENGHIRYNTTDEVFELYEIFVSVDLRIVAFPPLIEEATLVS